MVSGTQVPGTPYNPGRTERGERLMLEVRPPVFLCILVSSGPQHIKSMVSFTFGVGLPSKLKLL